jgi:DNA-binding LytR/AlgR family response regulator
MIDKQNRLILAPKTASMTCIIVEDDPLSQEVMKGLVERTGFLQLLQTFADPIWATQWLQTNSVDLILLDIEMPGLSGLDMLKILDHQPEVIIVSSKENYAIDAFEYDVTAYLLKPVSDYARFLKAVLKVQEKIQSKSSSAIGHPDRLYVKVDSLLTQILLDDLLWVEAYGDYIKIQTTQKLHTVYSTMKAIEDKLPPEAFVRVHRSFMVNLKKIENITGANLQIEKKIIPIGTSYREALMKKINQL